MTKFSPVLGHQRPQQVCSNRAATRANLLKCRSAMKTLYRSEEGDAAEEWLLCDGCYGEVADEVLLVADPAYCFGTCRACGDEWFSVRELSETAGGDATPLRAASAAVAPGDKPLGLGNGATPAGYGSLHSGRARGCPVCAGGMFMRTHEMLCRLVCFSPRGEGPNPPRRPPACSILDADFGEGPFHALGCIVRP